MMRKRFAFLAVLALVLSILPWYALADDGFSGSDGGSFSNSDGGVVYTAYGDNDTYKVYVRADNKWQAAVYACGGDPTYLSSEVRSKLSDPDYGGDFYAYAQTFEVMENPLEFPPWVLFSLPFFSNISDYMKSEVSNSLYTSALVDYKVVLAGGELTPDTPSTPEVVPGSFTSVSLQSFNWRYKNGAKNKSFYVTATSAVFEDGQLSVGSSTRRVSPWGSSNYYVPSFNAYVSSDAMEYAYSLVNQGYDVVFSFDLLNYNGTYFSGCSGRIVYGHGFSFAETSPGGDDLVTLLYGSDFHSVSFSQQPVYFDSSGPFSFIDGSPSEPALVSGNSLPVAFFSSPIYGIDNPPPAGDWPEPTAPATPDPPEVPTPTAPTETVDPDPTAPTITWPTSPTLVLPSAPVVSTTPDGIDYTALLTLINDNLNSIDSYLQNFYTSFNSFRSDFLSGIDDIVDGLRNIYQYLGHLNNILEVHCKHITDQIEESVYNLELYIKRLFEWLPKQLNFDAEFDYDDSAVTTLLRRIFNKIPGGSTGTPVSYKPNPQSDTPGFFDWLADLWHRFLIDLVSVLPDELGGLVDTISQLTHYFPFSIPWDMFALLALFAHDPVTPVFDVPWGYGGEEGEIQMVRVDLSAWDGVMETVRPVFLVGFCMQLAMITKDLLANFDLKQGGV